MLNDRISVKLFREKLVNINAKATTLKKMLKPINNLSAASFQLSHTIAQHGKPLFDGDYVKEAFKYYPEILCSFRLLYLPNKSDNGKN